MITSLLLACIATPGLRTDGIAPPTGGLEGGVGGAALFQPGGDADPLLGGGAGLMVGVGQDIGLGLAVVADGGSDGGGMAAAELRAITPLLGSREDPRLTLALGVSGSMYTDGAELGPWWPELGLIAGTPLPAHLRLYGGATVNWDIAKRQEGIWVEPTLGLSFRPPLGPRLSGLVGLEAAALTDGESFGLGPLLYLGLSGRRRPT